MYWLKIGNDGENESFDGLREVVEYLNECDVGRIDLWVGIGFVTPNYHGDDLVLLYVGGDNSVLIRALNSWERGYIETRLEEVYA